MIARALRDIRSNEIIFAGNNPFKFHERYVSSYGFKTFSLGETEQIPDNIYASRLEEAIAIIRPMSLYLTFHPFHGLCFRNFHPSLRLI